MQRLNNFKQIFLTRLAIFQIALQCLLGSVLFALLCLLACCLFPGHFVRLNFIVTYAPLRQKAARWKGKKNISGAQNTFKEMNLCMELGMSVGRGRERERKIEALIEKNGV